MICQTDFVDYSQTSTGIFGQRGEENARLTNNFVMKKSSSLGPGLYIIANIQNHCSVKRKIKIASWVRFFYTYISGAAELNAHGCAFAHPIFGPLVKKIMFLRTQNFSLTYKLRTQS